MGYTHYWTQVRDFTCEEWRQIGADVMPILNDVQHAQGVPLGDGEGNPGTQPVFTADHILFNGVGDDSHETFVLYRRRPAKEPWQRRRGGDFCKTARKPYDLAVTAMLCYLATVPGNTELFERPAFSVHSDGHGSEWLAGLAAARRALPRYANILDIPRDILKADRWCMPWVHTEQASGYAVNFCVDGKGYVWQRKSDTWCCFPSHVALAAFLDRTRQVTFRKRVKYAFDRVVFREDYTEANIWNATGSFDAARHAHIARSQATALAPLFPPDPHHAGNPPSYMRPGDMPPLETKAYYFEDLLRQPAG